MPRVNGYEPGRPIGSSGPPTPTGRSSGVYSSRTDSPDSVRNGASLGSADSLPLMGLSAREGGFALPAMTAPNPSRRRRLGANARERAASAYRMALASAVLMHGEL